jgi:hypothetical protein
MGLIIQVFWKYFFSYSLPTHSAQCAGVRYYDAPSTLCQYSLITSHTLLLQFLLTETSKFKFNWQHTQTPQKLPTQACVKKQNKLLLWQKDLKLCIYTL